MLRGFDDSRTWGNRQVDWPRIYVEETDKNYLRDRGSARHGREGR